MLFERHDRVTARQLRQFATALIVVTAVALLRVWWRQGAVGNIAVTLSSAALLCGVAGLIRPRAIEWLFRTLTTITWPIGVIVSEAMIVILYFVVVTPFGFALRLLKHDPLHRTIDRQAPTYWVARRPGNDQSRYFRQS